MRARRRAPIQYRTYTLNSVFYSGHEFGRALTKRGMEKLANRMMADGGFRLMTLDDNPGGLDPKWKFMVRVLEKRENTKDGPDEQVQLIDGHHREPVFRNKLVSPDLH